MDSQQIAELITILTAKVDQVKTGTDQANAAIKGYENTAKKSNEEAGKSFLKMAAEIGLTYEALKSFVIEGIEAASQAEELGIALDVVASHTNVSSAAIDTQRNAIEEMTFTVKDANGLLLAMARAHVDVSKASQVAAAATLYAKASGQSYEDTLSSLATTIETGMPRGLRQFGIGMGDVQAAMAAAKETLHAYGGELTPVERSTAMMNLILAKSADLQGINERSVGKAPEVYRSWGQSLKNAREEFGGLIDRFVEFDRKYTASRIKNQKGLHDNSAEQTPEEAQTEALKKQPPVYQEIKKNLDDLIKSDLNLTLNKNDFSDKTLRNVFIKEQEIARVTGESNAQQIKDLHDIGTEYAKYIDAGQQEILAGEIARKTIDMQIEKTKQLAAERKKMETEFAGAMAQSFTAMTGLFGKTAADIGQIWTNLLQKMLEQVLESKLMDIMGSLLGGGGKGNASGGGGDIFSTLLGIGGQIGLAAITGGASIPAELGGDAIHIGSSLGYDSPSNDARAYASGGKWFKDALTKFSQGYVNESNSPGGVAGMAGAVGAGGHTFHISVPINASGMMASPYDIRRAGVHAANIIKKTVGGAL